MGGGKEPSVISRVYAAQIDQLRPNTNQRVSSHDRVITGAKTNLILSRFHRRATTTQFQVMALPVSLRNSITPPELELVASEELIEIVPLISMERTAFISVRLQSL